MVAFGYLQTTGYQVHHPDLMLGSVVVTGDTSPRHFCYPTWSWWQRGDALQQFTDVYICYPNDVLPDNSDVLSKSAASVCS